MALQPSPLSPLARPVALGPASYPATAATAATPWWREPYVWLVVGGPLAVVVAGIYTAYIAMSNPDPLVDRSAYRQQAQVKAVSVDELARLQPAHQARNHAAAPVVRVVPAAAAEGAGPGAAEPVPTGR